MRPIDTIDTLVIDDLTDLVEGDNDDTGRFVRPDFEEDVDEVPAIVEAIEDDDTWRFVRLHFDALDAAPTDPDATSFYDITPTPKAPLNIQQASAERRRLIRDLRQGIVGLRVALAEGWDVGPELAYEERRLADIMGADRTEA